jgi:hypothetical protein
MVSQEAQDRLQKLMSLAPLNGDSTPLRLQQRRLLSYSGRYFEARESACAQVDYVVTISHS